MTCTSLLFLTILLVFGYTNCDVITALESLTVFELRSTLKLGCNVSTTGYPIEVEWFKDDVAISDIEALKERTEEKAEKNGLYVLLIKTSKEHDSGKYECRVTINDITHKIPMEAYNRVKLRTPGNVNVVEGEKLKIRCDVLGQPPPVLSWKIINETITESNDRVQLLPDDDTQLPNGMLIMENIQMSDRGVYTCIAYSNATKLTVKSETMVRIKDKYAALWPFLGICAEVFILCAIILIYEKKRNKAELEESDTDQSPDQKNTPNHGKDANLRHRQ